jgi:hypothetical protein
MFEDEALQAMLRSQTVMTRAELDARNSSERPETFAEVVARKYNDPDVVFVTEKLPDLHMAFSDEIELEFDDMPGGKITAEEAKKRITEARAKLLQVSI